jgi:hypothetical protein
LAERNDLGHAPTPLIEARHNRKYTRSSQVAVLGLWIAARAEQIRDMKPWFSVCRGWPACRFKREPPASPIGFAEMPTIVSSASSRHLWELAVAIGPAWKVFCTNAVEFAEAEAWRRGNLPGRLRSEVGSSPGGRPRDST